MKMFFKTAYFVFFMGLFVCVIACNNGNVAVQRNNQNYIQNSTFKSDYFTAVNKDWLLENLSFPSYVTTIKDKSDEKLIIRLDQMLNNPNERNAHNKKLYQTYLSGLNMEARNSLGVKPIQKYIQAYKNSNTVEDLIQADINALNGTGISVLFCVKNANIPNQVKFSSLQAMDNVDFDSVIEVMNYQNYIIKVLERFDYDSTQETALNLIKFETLLYKTQKNHPINQKTYSFLEMEERLPYAFEDLYSKTIFARPRVVFVDSMDYLEEVSQQLTRPNIEILRNYAIVHFYSKMAIFLDEVAGQDFFNFNNSINTTENKKFDNFEMKVQILDGLKLAFNSYVQELFVQIFCDDEDSPNQTKEFLEKMCEDIVQKYSEMLTESKFFTEKMTKVAVEKLNHTTINICYPKEFDDFLTNYTIQTNNYFEIITTALVGNIKEKNSLLLTSSSFSTQWQTSVYETTPIYFKDNNKIEIPCGAVQSPNYNKSASMADKYASMGFLLAQTIGQLFTEESLKMTYNNVPTYIFTNDGENVKAYYDFKNAIQNYYDGYEGLCGIKNSGSLSVEQDIVDYLALRCCYALIQPKTNMENRDFFAAFARCCRGIYTQSQEESMASQKGVALPRARVNLCVATFPEFYKTYDIRIGDEMFMKTPLKN